jgi:hypothetical protein
VADGIHVLDLDLGVHLVGPAGPHRDVGIDAHRAGLHAAIGRTDVAHLSPQGLDEFHRLIRRAEVRLGDDLDQRGTGSVEVHQTDRHAPFHLVHQLGHILFHVDVVNAQPLRLAVFVQDIDPPTA